jgi:hypothetical protein
MMNYFSQSKPPVARTSFFGAQASPALQPSLPPAPSGWCLSEKKISGVPVIYNLANESVKALFFTKHRDISVTQFANIPELHNLSPQERQKLHDFVEEQIKLGDGCATPMYFAPNVCDFLANAAQQTNAVRHVNQKSKWGIEIQDSFAYYFKEFFQAIDDISKHEAAYSFQEKLNDLDGLSDCFFVQNHSRIQGEVHTDSYYQIRNYSLTLYGTGTSIFAKKDNEKIRELIRKHTENLNGSPESETPQYQTLEPGFMGIFSNQIFHFAPITFTAEGEKIKDRMVLILTSTAKRCPKPQF